MPSVTAGLQVLLQGTVERTAQLSAAVQGDVRLTSDLDAVVQVATPYSILKLWGDLGSRFFVGNTSDANFFENFNPQPAATINQDLGSFSLGDRQVVFHSFNSIPTALAYDKYSLALAASADTELVGFRLLLALQFDELGENDSLLFGAFNGTNDPAADLAAQDFVGLAVETEKGHLTLRAWAGTEESPARVLVGREAIVGVPLILSIETTAASLGTATIEYGLYRPLVSVDEPFASLSLATSTAPTVTHVAMTSLGKRNADLPTSESRTRLSYVDVEPGPGSLADHGYYVTQAQGKWRPYLDRPVFQLGREGELLLEDNFQSVASYWRLDSDIASSAISVAGGEASVLGVCYADASGLTTQQNYRVEVEVAGASDAAGSAGWFGLGLYGTGDYTTDATLFAIALNTASNAYYAIDVEAGVENFATTSFPGTLVADQAYRLAIDVRTEGAASVVNAYLDDVLLHSTSYSGTITQGSPVLLVAGAQTTPVKYRNLVARAGMNDIFVQLSDDGIATTDTRSDTVFVDLSDPIITVHAFATESPVIVPDTVSPPVVKGSLNSGFSGVSMQWSCTHAGTWSLRANSTGATNGTEIAQGSYPRANANQVTGWSFADLPQVDGLYDVTLYVLADSGRVTAKRLGEYLLS